MTRCGVFPDSPQREESRPARENGVILHSPSAARQESRGWITFVGDTDATIVTIVHRGLERLGFEGPGWRERNEAGWAGLLPDYRRACVELYVVEAGKEGERKAPSRRHASFE